MSNSISNLDSLYQNLLEAIGAHFREDNEENREREEAAHIAYFTAINETFGGKSTWKRIHYPYISN